MNSQRLAFSASLILSLLAGGALTSNAAQPAEAGGAGAHTNAPAASAGNEALDAATFIQMAAWCGMREIELSRLAEQLGQRAPLREFAARLIRDHSVAQDRLARMAALRGVPMLSTNDFNLVEPPVSDGRAARPAAASPAPATPQRPVGIGAQEDPAQSRQGLGGPLGESDLEDIRRLPRLTGISFEHGYITQIVRDHVKAIDLYERASRSGDQEIRTFAEQFLPLMRQHHEEALRLASQTGGLEGEHLKPRPFRRQGEP